ncbi:MAG: DUF4352 domain-containing protein [Bacteroidota bacterium]|nr:DUF4352 domain-containing protein [Bacteroidota bacterium]
MHNSRMPHIEYDPSPRTHIIAKIAFVLIALLIVGAIIVLIRGRDDDEKRHITGLAKDRLPREVSTDKVLRTRFFNVVVDTVEIFDSIDDGNDLVTLPYEAGNEYFVINISFKNTDNESKMMPDGELGISRGNNELKYDNPEILTMRGWGVLMENIEPGITKKTRIVYKIPAGVSGKAYYYPDISYNQDRIFLADF